MNDTQLKDATTVKSGVGVIVVKGKKVLIGKRKGSHGEGICAFPGGHIEPDDDTLADCGQREVSEETGIISKVFSPDGYRDDLFTTYDILSEDGSKIYVTCYLIAEYLHGGEVLDNGYIKPLEADKCEYWEWVDIDTLVQRVTSKKQKEWIPLEKVIYYLKQMWKENELES